MVSNLLLQLAATPYLLARAACCPSAGLVGELAEQLRLILEPTLASRLAGDYRSGKRINMKKVGGSGKCSEVDCEIVRRLAERMGNGLLRQLPPQGGMQKRTSPHHAAAS